jgi:hypothetical protein
MTDLLDKAFKQVSQLPSAEQDAVAAIVLKELASEERWTALFAESESVLEKFAEEALAEHRTGRTKPPFFPPCLT